ncbi:MAG: hypothetical protein FD143_3689, partial [Ignavibacteria bacterium]
SNLLNGATDCGNGEKLPHAIHYLIDVHYGLRLRINDIFNDPKDSVSCKPEIQKREPYPRKVKDKIKLHYFEIMELI